LLVASRTRFGLFLPQPGTQTPVSPFLFYIGNHAEALKWRAVMGELKSKIEGNVNEAVGEMKQKSNDPETRAEGRGQEVKGKAQQTKGEVEGALGDDI